MSKKLLLNSFIYSCSGLLIKCFSFFLLPLYTSALTAEDYGIQSLSVSFISTSSFIVAFSLFSAVLRFYVDLKNDEEKLRRFYGTIVTFVFVSGLVFTVALCIFKQAVSYYLFSGVDFYPIIFVCLISLIFSCEQTVFDNILRSQQKALKSSIFSLIYFAVTVCLNVFFVVYLRLGALGTVLASLGAAFLYTIYFLIEMLYTKKITICIDIVLLKDALRYSVPIIPHNLSTQIALFISKILIGGKASLGGLGVYTVATQFGNIADTIQTYVDSAYGPWLYEKLHIKDGNYKNSIQDMSGMLASVIGFFFLGISLFSQDYIVLFINRQYIEAWKYIPLIVAVFGIKTAYYFYVEVLFYFKDASKKLFIATLSSSFINIFISYYSIPEYGVLGSIMADAIAMIIRVAIVYFFSKQYEDIGLKMNKFIKNFFIVELFTLLGLSLSFTMYPYSFNIYNLLFKIVIVCVYVLVSVLLNRNQLPFVLELLKRSRKE